MLPAKVLHDTKIADETDCEGDKNNKPCNESFLDEHKKRCSKPNGPLVVLLHL